MSDSDELVSEQEYFYHARELRELKREQRLLAPSAAVTGFRDSQIVRDASRLSEALGSPDDAVAFGRIVTDLDTLYIGPSSIAGPGDDMLVISWKLRAAEPFYKASHHDPLGVQSKRTYRTKGHQILTFEDLVFEALARDVAALDAPTEAPFSPTDTLLSELNQKRTGEMRAIVQTIQAAQYDLITSPLDQVLVIQGGPGTGKTAIATHRVSWLLYNHKSRLNAGNVLVVGPNKTFTRYIKSVLPSLGDEDVRHVEITRLAPQVDVSAHDPFETVGLKGDARMAGLLRRALAAKLTPPGALLDGLRVGTRVVRLDEEAVRKCFDAAKAGTSAYNLKRTALQGQLLGLIEAATLDLLPENQRAAARELAYSMMPRISASELLDELFTSTNRLEMAGGANFSIGELSLLKRASHGSEKAVWSPADLPLIDEAEFLIRGEPDERYALIIVDEAQDLSAMQLRSISRRSSSGCITLVGDIAQSTGPFARDRWDEVLAHLPTTHPHVMDELRYGYRVPRQVFQLAQPLLAASAPHVTPPVLVRDGPADPELRHVTIRDRSATSVEAAQAHAAKGRSVGIICPDTCRDDIEREMRRQQVEWIDANAGELGGSINLVSPEGSKGLEFDSVIVVEPTEIVRSDPRGERLLYIALTRTTKYLDVVYSDAATDHLNLPLQVRHEQNGGERTTTAAPTPASTSVQRHTPTSNPIVESVARALADDLRQKAADSVKDALLIDVLRRAAEIIGEEILP